MLCYRWKFRYMAVHNSPKLTITSQQHMIAKLLYKNVIFIYLIWQLLRVSKYDVRRCFPFMVISTTDIVQTWVCFYSALLTMVTVVADGWMTVLRCACKRIPMSSVDGLKQYRCRQRYLAASDDAGVTCSLMQNSDQNRHAKQSCPASTQAVLPSNV